MTLSHKHMPVGCSRVLFSFARLLGMCLSCCLWGQLLAQVPADSLIQARGEALKAERTVEVIRIDKELMARGAQTGEDSLHIAALVWLAEDHFLLLKDKPRCLELLREAGEKVNASSSITQREKGLAFEDVAQAYMKVEEWDSMRIHLQRAKSHFITAEDWEAAVKTLIGRGFAEYQRRNFRLAIEELEEAEALALQQLPDTHKHFGTLYQFLGAAYGNLGDYDQAMTQAAKSLSLRQRTASTIQKDDLANSYVLVGYFYRQRGDFDRALEYYVKSLNLLQGVPEKEGDYCNLMVSVLNNLSAVWYRKRNYPQAIRYAQQQLNLVEKWGKRFTEGNYILACNNLAVPLIESGAYAEAESLLRVSLVKVPGDYQSLHNLSYVYRQTGRYEEAKDLLLRVLPMYLQQFGSQNDGVAKVYRHLGVVYTRLGRLEEALAYFQKALMTLASDFSDSTFYANPSLESVNNQLIFLRTLRDKAEALQLYYETHPGKQDALEAALSSSRLAVALIGRMRREYTEGSKQFLMSEYYPVYERGIELSGMAFERGGERAYLEEAFLLAEQSKAVLLREGLRESQARQAGAIPQELAREEQELKVGQAFYRKQIFNEQRKGDKADKEKLALWQEKLFALNRAHEQLAARLEKDFPEYYQQKYQDFLPSLVETQAYLSVSGSRLVEYFQGDRHLFVFSLDGNSLQMRPLVWGDSLRTALLDFVRLMSDRNAVLESGAAARKTFAQTSWGWYQRLVGPEVAGRTGKTLVLVPDGLLGFLPFEALVVEQPGEVNFYHELRFLIQQCPVRYTFSAALLLEENQKSSSRRGGPQFAGFAPAYGAAKEAAASRSAHDREGLAPLANNQPEVQEIQALLGGEAFLAEAATEASFRSLGTRSRILHLAMHALTHDEDPLYSGLVFSEDAYQREMTSRADRAADSLQAEEELNDGFLYAYELYNLRLKADMAVLSACNTGGGKLSRGEGIMSLSRAFRYAGCPNLLMSLWQVDDQATRDLMLAFYRQLKNGVPKDEALRLAKLEYLETHDETHPHYWAAFVLIGDGQPVALGSPVWLYLGAVLLILAGIAGVYFFVKKSRKPA